MTFNSKDIAAYVKSGGKIDALLKSRKRRLDTKTCSICKQNYEGFGNNAAPFRGRCCDTCNSVHVIPARIAEIYSRRSK